MSLAPDPIDLVGMLARERLDEVDELRRLPADLATELTATGITRGFAPREIGAPELSVAEFVDTVERLGYHDGSLGWCAMISCTTSLLSGYVDADWLEPLFGAADSTLGGFAGPMGRGRPAEHNGVSGLEVTGEWSWGSGTYNCTWIGGGVRVSSDGPVAGPDGRPLRAPFVFFAPEQVELLDTWHAAGLRGTGSTDYRVSDAFVPSGRWADLGHGPRIDRTLYRFPFLGALAVGVAAVALGLARRAVDELVELALVKKPSQSSRTLAERPVVQAQVAEAEAAWRSGRSFLDRTIDEAWRSTGLGTVDDQSKLLLRLAAANATERAAHAVSLCYHAGGGSSVYLSSPLQRLFRDVHVATQHAMVAPRLNEVLGRARLGLPTDYSGI